MVLHSLRRAFLFAAVLALAPSFALAEPVNDFTLPSAKNRERVTLSDLRGDVIYLSFWATWCGSCKMELNHLQELHETLEPEGFKLLAISSDDARAVTKVKSYVRQKGFDFTVLLDTDSTVTGVYNPSKTLPYGVLIGRDHAVAKVYSGYTPGDEVRLLADIQAELAKPRPQ